MKQQKKTHFIIAKNWLIGRFGIESVIDFARKKTVPAHKHSLWYYFGGITLTLFIMQIVTGFLLLFYYRPMPEVAHDSIVAIMTEVPYGWLIRSIHSWAANLMVASVLIHFFSTMLMRAYRLPREFTWVTGMIMLLITLTMGFSGYLLPWNELSFFATKVGTGLARKVPIVGKYIFYLLRGTENISGETLTRFFGLHVCILPLLLGTTLAIHIWLIQAHGMSVPISIEKRNTNPKRRETPFFPNFFYRDMISSLTVFGIVVTLAVLLPKEIGRKADLLAPAPAGLKPEWFFVFLFQTLKYIPSKILFIDGEVCGIVIIGLAVILLFLVPILDRRARKGDIGRLFTAIAILLIVYFLGLTIIGYLAETPQQPVAQTAEEVHIAPNLNRILALIGFWCVLVFIISFLFLKVRHYDRLSEQGYWDATE